MFLLDTNIISELRKPKPHGAVVAWISGIDAADLYLSVVTFGEIQTGIEITRTQDQAKAELLTLWADALAQTSNIIAVDATIFRRHSRLMHGTTHDVWEDALIAATALEKGATVVTRNVRDFESFGVKVLNPFEG
jgi:toxin FitB